MNPYQYDSNSESENTYSPPLIKNTAPLWVESQITAKFVAPLISFSKERRFKWSSIYWPEDTDRLLATRKKRKSHVYEAAQKISKMIDEEEKNQVRIKQIKRSFSIGKSSVATARRESGVVLSTKKPFKLTQQNEQIVLRLTPREARKQSLMRDRHGNRCNLYQDPEQMPREDVNGMYSSTGFKTSRKMKLQLPHNYNPGPGAYQIKRYLADLDRKRVSPAKNQKQQKTVG